MRVAAVALAAAVVGAVGAAARLHRMPVRHRRAAAGVRLRSSAWRIVAPPWRRAAQHRGAVARAVPDLVDLLVIAASAGHPVTSALVHVAPRSPPAVRPPLTRAVQHLRHGASLRTVLHELDGALGPGARPMLQAMADAAQHGVALAPALAAVSREARDQRRRAAQESARRLPVALLFPLVACTLPAAVLVSVVPVVAVALRSLAL